MTRKTQLLVIGSGPGGYTAAFRAADLGMQVTLVERYDVIGGVCLNVGCIPSKALLHTAAIINEADSMAAHGVVFGEPSIDLDKLRGFKETVVGQLTKGLSGMAGQRKVTVLQGIGAFTSPNEIGVESEEGTQTVSFAQAIIAAGSQAWKLPGLPWDDPRLMDSTDALDLDDIPGRLLVIGGGTWLVGAAADFLGTQGYTAPLTTALLVGDVITLCCVGCFAWLHLNATHPATASRGRPID